MFNLFLLQINFELPKKLYMSFSQQSWQHIENIYQNILQHPFNQKLTKGTLEKKTFYYYIEQDTHYLKDFSKALAILSAKSEITSQQKNLLQFAQEALIAEEAIVHQYFREQPDFITTNNTAQATLTYTNYLLRTCLLDPIAIGIAAVLPCFWIYAQVGKSILKNASMPNPFEKWIQTYAGEAFHQSVQTMIDIYNTYAAYETAQTKQKMLQAFYTSSILEWHFWNDAYQGNQFDLCKI